MYDIVIHENVSKLVKCNGHDVYENENIVHVTLFVISSLWHCESRQLLICVNYRQMALLTHTIVTIKN